MYIKKKQEADFKRHRTLNKIPLLDNNINMLSVYSLQQNNYKINKSRC